MDWNANETTNEINNNNSSSNTSNNNNGNNNNNNQDDSNQTSVEDDFAHMNASINLNHLSQLIGDDDDDETGQQDERVEEQQHQQQQQLMSGDNIELMSSGTGTTTAAANVTITANSTKDEEEQRNVKTESVNSSSNDAGISNTTIMILDHHHHHQDQQEKEHEKLIQQLVGNSENSLDFSAENLIKQNEEEENEDIDDDDDADDKEEAILGDDMAVVTAAVDSSAAATLSTARFNYKCRYCLHLTKFKARIIEHMLTAHNVNLMQCPYANCGRKFKDEWKLKRHLVSNKDHAKLGTFQSLADSIRQHCIVTPQKIGQYPCPVCVVDNSNNNNNAAHQIINNLDEQQTVIAHFLSKNTDNSLYFDTYDLLKDHLLLTHPNFNIDYYFVCKQCGQVFLNRYKLSCHLFNVHSGKRKRRSSSSVVATTSTSRGANKNIADVSTAFINFGSHQFVGHPTTGMQFGGLSQQQPQQFLLGNKQSRGSKQINSSLSTSSSTSSMMMLHNGSYVTPAKFLLDCRKFLCVVCDRKFKRVRDLQSHVQIMHKTISDEQRDQLKLEIEKTNSLIVKAKSMRNRKVKEPPPPPPPPPPPVSQQQTTPQQQQQTILNTPTTILDINNNVSMSSSSKSYLLNNQQLINMGSLILNPVNQIIQQQQQQPSGVQQHYQQQQQTLPTVQFVKLCFICNKMFKVDDETGKTDKSFVRHMQIQHGMNEKGERLVDCPVCEKWFFNRQQMERHMRTHQVWIQVANNNLNSSSGPTMAMGPNEFKEKHSILYCHECAECHLFFKSLKVLTKHKLDAHNLKPVFECSHGRVDNDNDDQMMNNSESATTPVAACQLQFEVDQIDAYLEHARVHPQKNITCLKCQIKFGNKNLLRNHMKNVHYKVNTVARKRVSRPRQQRKEPTTMTTTGPVSLNTTASSIVNLSGSQFNAAAAAYAVATAAAANVNHHHSGKSYLKQHNEKSNNVASYLNAAFPSSVVNHQTTTNARRNSENLVVSILNNNGEGGVGMDDSPDQHICATCGKEFTSRNSLHNHLATHNTSDLKLFLCQACGASYKTRAELSKHVGEEHETLKHKTCIDCGETFKTSFHLKRHMLTRHSNIRPFRCNHCSMTFARKDKLKQHEAKHINHPLYSCGECGKGFYRKEHLKDHEISKHSKQYPFSCEYCAKGFVHAKDLHRHIRVRHLNAVLSDPVKSESLGLTASSSGITTKSNRSSKSHQSFQIPKVNYQSSNQQQQQQLLENMFNQRLITNPTNVVGYSSKSIGSSGGGGGGTSYNQSTVQQQVNQSTNAASTVSDFKSKKISSILKSNALVVSGNTHHQHHLPSTSTITNYTPTLDLTSSSNNTAVHLNNTNARFITNNDFNAAVAAANLASLDPQTGNLIYNQQLISIPIHELNTTNPNQFINSHHQQHNQQQQHQSSQRVVNATLKIRDQLNNNNMNKFNDHEVNKSVTAAHHHHQILSHAKINNILNGLDTTTTSSTPSSTHLVDNTVTTKPSSSAAAAMKTFKCPQCNKCFFYENYLRKHMLSKHSQSPLYSCSYCGKGFSNKSNAKSHVNNSHLDYSCPLCGKVAFKSKSLAVRHMQAAHNVDANSTLSKQYQPIKHVKMDVKILESSSTATSASNSGNNISNSSLVSSNNNNNIIMATTNNAVGSGGGGSFIIDNSSLQQHHLGGTGGILNLIPISGTLDLSSLGAAAHISTADVMDLNSGQFHTTGATTTTATDLSNNNNNINIINLSFSENGKSSTGGGNSTTNYVNDLSGLTSQSIQTNSGGHVALLPSTFTLNFLNNQQSSSNQQQQQQQQTFVLNQFGQQQQQQNQTGNATLNSASYFI